VKTRKPTLTERRIVALLSATDMAQADMDAAGDHPSAADIAIAYEFARKLASWWESKHGRWPGSARASDGGGE
jgi:hypothetical protein